MHLAVGYCTPTKNIFNPEILFFHTSFALQVPVMTTPIPSQSITEFEGQLPGFLFIDHLAIMVPAEALEAQVEAYTLMGFRVVHREDIGGSDQVREVLLQIGNSPNLIQLVSPTAATSPVQKALERNNGKGGLHHVGFRVQSAQAAYDWCVTNGFRVLEAAPRPGSRGTTVFFLHPKAKEQAPFHVLMEVVEDPAASSVEFGAK